MNNNYRFTLPKDDKYINLPIEIKWDFFGRDDSIEVYQEEVVEEIIGSPKDFEILRFSHHKYFSAVTTSIPPEPVFQTRLQYQFNFYSGDPINVTTSTSANWVSSYLDSTPIEQSGFTPTQIYYYEKPFTKSFFKLDFYDTNTGSTQNNYFTIILPVQQGLTESVSISPLTPNVNIKIPTMNLDFVGDKEGFFIYWLRKTDFLNIDTFYVTAKFFDARFGEFIRMMNQPQSSLPSDKFIFNTSDYFYYKVVLDYTDKTYKFYYPYDTNSTYRLGGGTPIKWYEYINPV